MTSPSPTAQPRRSPPAGANGSTQLLPLDGVAVTGAPVGVAVTGAAAGVAAGGRVNGVAVTGWPPNGVARHLRGRRMACARAGSGRSDHHRLVRVDAAVRATGRAGAGFGGASLASAAACLRARAASALFGSKGGGSVLDRT